MGKWLIRVCWIDQVEIEGAEQPENTTTANSKEPAKNVTEIQANLAAQKTDVKEQHEEIKEHKVLSEKDSCPSTETKCGFKS